MTHRLIIPTLVLLAACGKGTEDSGVDPGSCEASASKPEIGLSHYGTFDNLGTVMYCGIPPQGGSPYAPFGIRIRGIDPEENGGMHLVLNAVDTTSGEKVGTGEFFERFLCSNVGESEGYWVAAEFHLRFDTYSLDDLHGRNVALNILAEGPDASQQRAWPFDMDCEPGD